MLKSYLADHGISIYWLSKNSLIPYSTLNDLINHKHSIENLKSGQLKALSDSLSLDMNTVYDMCVYSPVIYSEKYNVRGSVSIEHKSYFISVERYGKTIKKEILPVKKESTAYLNTLALWKLEEILDSMEMERAYESLCIKKKG